MTTMSPSIGLAAAVLLLGTGFATERQLHGDLQPATTIALERPGQGLALSPDGSRLAVLGLYGSGIEILKQDGELLRHIGRSGLIVTPEIAFVDDNTILTAAGYEAGQDAMLEHWQVIGDTSRRVVIGPAPGRGDFYNRSQILALSSDHALAIVLASHRQPTIVQVVDTQAWRAEPLDLSTWLGPNDTISSLAASSRSGPIAIGTVGGRLLIVDPMRKSLLRDTRVYRRGRGSPEICIYSVAFSPDQKWIATGRGPSMTSSVVEHYDNDPQGSEGLKIWDVANGAFVRSASASNQPVRQLSWSSDSNSVAAVVDPHELLLVPRSPASFSRASSILGLVDVQFTDHSSVLATLGGNGVMLFHLDPLALSR